MTKTDHQKFTQDKWIRKNLRVIEIFVYMAKNSHQKVWQDKQIIFFKKGLAPGIKEPLHATGGAI